VKECLGRSFSAKKKKMPCSKEEALVSLFFNVSSFFLLLFLFFYCATHLLAKLFHFLGSNPIIFFFFFFFLIEFFVFCRNQNGYEYNLVSEDEEKEEAQGGGEGFFHAECLEKDNDLVADIIHGGEALFFHPNNHPQRNQALSEEFMSINEDPDHEDYAPEILSVDDSHEGEDRMFEDEELPPIETDSVCSSAPNQGCPTMPITTIDNDKNRHGTYIDCIMSSIKVCYISHM